MKLIIDRIENGYAVCENDEKQIINIHISKLPTNAKVGDVICFTDKDVIIDKQATEIRKKYIEEITEDIWQ